MLAMGVDSLSGTTISGLTETTGVQSLAGSKVR